MPAPLRGIESEGMLLAVRDPENRVHPSRRRRRHPDRAFAFPERRAMLEELRVRNLALIEDATVHFGPGLNVLSGETGEGKSLVLEALDLLLGERSDRDLVRTGSAECAVEGRFRLDAETSRRLREATELVEGGGELIVRRVVGADGRSRAWIDGNLCPLSVLKAVGLLLGDVHRQRDQLGLLRMDAQRGVLDRLAGLDADIAACADAFERRRRLLADAEQADADAEARRERIEHLRDAVRELDQAAPRLGETDALLGRMAASHEVAGSRAWSRSGRRRLVGRRRTAAARLSQASRAILGHAGLDPRIAALIERIETLKIEADDVGRDAARLRHAFDQVRGRIDTVGERTRRAYSVISAASACTPTATASSDAMRR
jgi:DNA repair protein RecN (Recombination protein N)